MARSSHIFLNAEWRNLIVVSYHAPAELLAPHLPQGLELDIIEGHPTVSLVAFQFLNTRVFGVPWPGFVNFPEWNLRFYVKTREKTPRRGVVFVREFVPSRIVSGIAWRVYNEPYVAAPVRFTAQTKGAISSARCEVDFKRTTHTIEATASTTLEVPHDAATATLIKEHQWGFGTTRGGRTLCYEVTHPVWRVHQNAASRVSVDWEKMYGEEWRVMQRVEPFSTVLAEGSAITVSTGMRL